jgi:hypothetical protein
MMYPEWFRTLLIDAAAVKQAHVVASLGPINLRRLYDEGLAPSIEAILRHLDNEERWRKLCQQIQVESDPARMVELCRELDLLREQREKRKGKSNSAA